MASTQLALPYSLAKTAKTGLMLCSQTSLSWEAAFSIGEDQLLIRSCSRAEVLKDSLTPKKWGQNVVLCTQS